jgi:hypothetical protein
MRLSILARREPVFRAVVASVILISLAGCQNGGPRRMAAREPGLSGPLEVGPPTAVVEGPAVPVRTVTWVDRHPLFARPREMYETTDNNPVIKTAAAVVIGIPTGFVGEIRQIVVGAPAPPAFGVTVPAAY